MAQSNNSVLSIMSIKLNWSRVKQLHANLLADGWKDNDKLLFIIIDKGGKPKKAIITFKDFYQFCWNLVDDPSMRVLTFVIQDIEGRVIYRHKQITGNEEVTNGGHTETISHWAALTPEEKEMYLTILMSQIDSYER